MRESRTLGESEKVVFLAGPFLKFYLFGMQLLEEITANALKLPVSDQIELASRLLRNAEGENDADEAEDRWDAEIDERIRQIDSGEVEMVPVEQVLAELRKLVRK